MNRSVAPCDRQIYRAAAPQRNAALSEAPMPDTVAENGTPALARRIESWPVERENARNPAS
jgi:hypothetical protein